MEANKCLHFVKFLALLNLVIPGPLEVSEPFPVATSERHSQNSEHFSIRLEADVDEPVVVSNWKLVAVALRSTDLI